MENLFCVFFFFCLQLFWEKKLSGLNAYDIAEELVKTMELPKGLQGVWHSPAPHIHTALAEDAAKSLACWFFFPPLLIVARLSLQVWVRAAQIRPCCRPLRALCTPAPLPSPVSCRRPWRRTPACGSTRHSLCARPSSSRTRTSGGPSHSIPPPPTLTAT